jgi:tetratricopeptide (TPR) repeat protein
VSEPSRTWRGVALLAAALLLGAPTRLPAAEIPEPGLDYFSRGVAQYRSGDYPSALYLFQLARSAGNRSPNLSYDIALTLYQLGRDDEARAAFEHLSFQPGYEAIAEYHLGLIATRAGDREAAASSLRRTAEGTKHAHLRQLAAAALAGLDTLLPRAATALYASAGAGFDSNAGYQSDDLQDTADSADSFFEGIGVIDHPFGNGRYVMGSVYARQYADFGDYSQQTGQVALRSQVGGHDWQASITGGLEASFLGGESLHNAASVAGEAERVAGPGYLIARLGVTRLAAGQVYPELEGWRQRAGVEYALSRVAVGYEIERNDRDDLREDGDFASRSPLRHQVAVRSHRPVTGRLTLEWRARYRISAYADADRVDGATERRRDTLAETQLGGRWRLSKAWSVLTEARYTRNDSNIGGYEYDRVSGGVNVEMTM